VLQVGRRAPIQSGSDRLVTTRPHSETGGAEARVRYTPTRRSPTLAMQIRPCKRQHPGRRAGSGLKRLAESDVSIGLLTGLEPLEIAANAFSVRFCVFPGGVNPRNVT